MKFRRIRPSRHQHHKHLRYLVHRRLPLALVQLHLHQRSSLARCLHLRQTLPLDHPSPPSRLVLLLLLRHQHQTLQPPRLRLANLLDLLRLRHFRSELLIRVFRLALQLQVLLLHRQQASRLEAHHLLVCSSLVHHSQLPAIPLRLRLRQRRLSRLELHLDLRLALRLAPRPPHLPQGRLLRASRLGLRRRARAMATVVECSTLVRHLPQAAGKSSHCGNQDGVTRSEIDAVYNYGSLIHALVCISDAKASR